MWPYKTSAYWKIDWKFSRQNCFPLRNKNLCLEESIASLLKKKQNISTKPVYTGFKNILGIKKKLKQKRSQLYHLLSLKKSEEVI